MPNAPHYFCNTNVNVNPFLCLRLLLGPYTSVFPRQNPVCVSPLSHTCHMAHRYYNVSLINMRLVSLKFTAQIKKVAQSIQTFYSKHSLQFPYITDLRVYLLQLSFCIHRLRNFISLYFIKHSIHGECFN